MTSPTDHSSLGEGEIRDRIHKLSAAHDLLLSSLHDLTDEQCRQPSRLPDWTRGHVLTHLARNAEALNRLATGLVSGIPGVMYPDGPAGRNADIEAGSGRPASALVAHIAVASAVLDITIAQVTLASWQTGSIRGVTTDWPASQLLFMRRREVCAHLVDADVGVSFADLPADYLQSEVEWGRPRVVEAGAESALDSLPPAAAAAWVLGRETPPGLPAINWG
jgi:maleylpyruvate isomerase